MNTPKNFRPCDECNKCCKGSLYGNAHGNPFGPKRPCIFLVKEKCSIYETRPDVCRKFQCAWSQHLLPEDMRPDKSGLLVSVETNNNGEQFLKAIELMPDISYSEYQKLEKAVKDLKTSVVYVRYHKNV